MAFGLVATLQSLQKGYGGFLATRIMLGVTECGYIPGKRACLSDADWYSVLIDPTQTGSLYVISTFYKRNELAKRNSMFFLGSGMASATSGLLGYALLPLGDRYPSRHGWQWLMIGEL
jgi:MFS family permease